MDTGRILVMRHAEKSGDPLDPHLSPAGVKRAQKLVTYIPETFGKPDYLFATLQSKHSNRPYETVEPLAKKLGLSIEDDFADQDYGALAHKLLHKDHFEGKTTVVCWHHGNIPPLCHSLGATSGQFPNPWPSLVFNLVLQIDFKGGTPTVTIVAEPF
jgi:broad specificity phosphatase PhoE